MIAVVVAVRAIAVTMKVIIFQGINPSPRLYPHPCLSV